MDIKALIDPDPESSSSPTSLHHGRKRKAPEISKAFPHKQSPPNFTKYTEPDDTEPDENPPKKWTEDEDTLIIKHRVNHMKWDEIAKKLPGRSSIGCRLRYQNYLEKKIDWDSEKINILARTYER
jgi:Myb-like DNA-binding domain